MRNVRRVWGLLCTGAALLGTFVYGAPQDGEYLGFSIYAALVFFAVLVFVWLPGVLALFALEWLIRAYRRARN
ncbi:MAG: hypothetical protein OEV36_02310 [Myxococcales bacterium]|nr:hypothetical protein [Thermoleophilia bacterium]MDH4281464.1 hypothetical protein [Myxococcales bacterium]MDH5281509.1 hypothetical protein [Thermoleophilia bacterium]